MIVGLLLYILAQAPPTTFTMADLKEILGWVTSFVAAVVGAIMVKNAKSQGKTEGKQEALMIGPQPFKVQLAEEFVTRREFERLEATIAVNATRMEGLFERTMDSVEASNTRLTKQLGNQNDRLTKKIEEIGSAGHAGRAKIWDKVNEQRESIAAIEAVSDVATQIGKLAEALQPPVTHQ